MCVSQTGQAALEDLNMHHRAWTALSVLLLSSWISGASPEGDERPGVPHDHARRMQDGLALFKAKVRPVLIQQCLGCHGGKSIKGDLDLTDRKPLLDSGVLEGGGTDC